MGPFTTSQVGGASTPQNISFHAADVFRSTYLKSNIFERCRVWEYEIVWWILARGRGWSNQSAAGAIWPLGSGKLLFMLAQIGLAHRPTRRPQIVLGSLGLEICADASECLSESVCGQSFHRYYPPVGLCNRQRVDRRNGILLEYTEQRRQARGVSDSLPSLSLCVGERQCGEGVF